MASNTLADGSQTLAPRPRPSGQKNRGLLLTVLHSLASLRLTVVLFALSIVLIFAGTLAQVKMDIWQVMGLYFRTWFAWIPLQVFFPPAFFPSEAMQAIPGGFYFPGGFLIGSAMAINLLAAHGVRFTVQARGNRLLAGLVTLALGVLIAYGVILGGSDKDIVEGSKGLNIPWLWGGVEAALAMLWMSTLYGIWEVGSSRVWERRLLIVAGALLGTVLGVLIYEGPAVMPDASAIRILWQLIKATTAALVLLAGCTLIFRKRAGIVLLHAGVGLMMANELIVYSLHVETMMHLAEGDRTNYAEDTRSMELAVISPAEQPAGSEAKADDEGTLEDVTVVSGKALQKNAVIRSPDLPFDVEPVKYFANSALHEIGAGADNPATAGAGLRLAPKELRAGAGTDMEQRVDVAAAYVTLLDKQSGAKIGTYLVGRALRPQSVEVGGKKYDLIMRFERHYKPYIVKLIDVERRNYDGTETAQNYSSDVQLIDPAHDVDREVHIWMNNPLRYAGDTLYQSGYDKGPPETTTLQVVKNIGWMTPYVGCMIVAVGMLAHFSLTLVRFLRRRDAEELAENEHVGLAEAARSIGKKPKAKHDAGKSRDHVGWTGIALPAIVVLLLAGWLAGHASPPKAKEAAFNVYEFGKLPLLYEGRLEPFDTLARNSLLILSGKQTVRDPAPEHPWWKFWVVGKEHSAVEWLLDAVTRSPASFGYRMLRVENPEVLALLDLKPRSGLRYSINEIRPHLEDFIVEVTSVHKFLADAKKAGRDATSELTVYQKKLMELGRRMQHYEMLSDALSPPPIRKDHAIQDWEAARMRGEEARDETIVPLAVPPQTAAGRWDYFPLAWQDAFAAQAMNKTPNPAAISLETILYNYGKGDVEEFNRAVEKYSRDLATEPPANANLNKVGYEAWFDHFEPFYSAQYLNLTAFALIIGSWIGWSRLLNRTAFCVLLLTLAVHTLGLVSRIYISGRPPVINLYSAAVFIGLGGMVFGLTLEVIYRLGIGNLIASVSGFATLLIAHFLASTGDTLKVLQAVLDTQFWLATHVVCVTLGYCATFVAGMLGIIYLVNAVGRPRELELGRTVSRMTYGTLCFAIFFSFVGTVLGGLWADDSWGRFWGWDPKENGALMIVAWNALVLHARWGRLVGDRGLAMLTVWGNAVTAWSFFGVNELGVGLHNYGFTEGVAMCLGIFVLSQLAIIVLSPVAIVVLGFFGYGMRSDEPAPTA